MMSEQRNRLNRREALKSAGVMLGGVVLADRAEAEEAGLSSDRQEPASPTLCLFSKPLHNRSFEKLPETLKELGIDAVDLTCRPGGHVLPERAAEDLPRAVELLRQAGVVVPMITTGIVDAHKDHAETIVKTTASLNIRYAKIGYYPYGNLAAMHKTLKEVKAKLRDIAALCRRYGVWAGFHNHSGNNVGAAMWDLRELLDGLPEDAIGSYFDVRHATTEGGLHGWRIGMNLLAPRMRMAAIKDFHWERGEKRNWHPVNVSMGEGMVCTEEAFRWLARQRFGGPISLHMEHFAGGEGVPAVGSENDSANLASIRHDWAYVREMMEKTGLA